MRICLLLLTLAACKPSLPDLDGGCRNFQVTTWGESKAPWSDFDWSAYEVVDEPLLTWEAYPDLRIAPNVEERLAALRTRFANAHAQGKKTWVNWSSEEFDLLYMTPQGPDRRVGADIVSFDDYAGPYDWWLGTTPSRLEVLLLTLDPGQKMGLVPEAFPTRYESEKDLILMNALYFDWALTHNDQGHIAVFAPYVWTGGIDRLPGLEAYLEDLMSRYSACPAAS